MRLKKNILFKKTKTYFFSAEKKSKIHFLKNKILYNLKKDKKNEFFVILEKEIICEINTSIDILFKDKINSKHIDVTSQNDCLLDMTTLVLYFKKNRHLNNFYKKKTIPL